MALSTALLTATSGLRVTQEGINVVSQNVANADSVGYTRRRMQPVQSLAGDRTTGVRSGDVQRLLDVVAQRQLRLESSGAGYTGLRTEYASAIERLMGKPGAAGSLDKAVNDYASSLQALAANPSDTTVRAGVVDRARSLAGLVGATADGIQSLRTDAESRIGAIVKRADGLLQAIQAVNGKVLATPGRVADAGLLDERDRLVGELSGLMDVKVTTDASNGIRIATNSGQTLFDSSIAVRLSFDARTDLGPESTYVANSPQRGVGTVFAQTGTGQPVDLIERGAFRSGEIRAAIEMRDEVLVQAQRQLDELAAGLAAAGSERRTEGVPATGGGFQVGTAGLAPGDMLQIAYVQGGVRREATVLVRNGAANPPAPMPTAADAANGLYVLDLGSATPYADLQGQLGTLLTVNATAPNVRFSNGTGAGTIESLARVEVGRTSPAVGGAYPVFTDPNAVDADFGGVHPLTARLTGLAQRLSINEQLVRNPALVNGRPDPGTPSTTFSGDATRANALLDNLTKASRTFSAQTGVGGTGAPYRASVSDFARSVIETQAVDAESAARLDEGQKIALASIESRFAKVSGVNIDEEMSQLVQLQTAYGANARVMSAVRDMLDMLMRI